MKNLNIIKLGVISFFIIPIITFASTVSFPTKIDTLQERINLQVVLNRVLNPSPNLVVDGVIGKKSIQAIQSFQESRGLVPDGKVGPITRSALEFSQTGTATTTTNTSSNTNTTTSTGSTSTSTYTAPGCLPGAKYNAMTGELCSNAPKSLPSGCTYSTKYSPLTGVLCSQGEEASHICTGSSMRSCTVYNGQGYQYRSCNEGNWSSYGTCIVSTCNSGYQISGGACVATTCSGLSTQSCTIGNGTGIQSRTCNSGVWSNYNSCTVSTCNSGYQISGNACVATTCSGSSTQSCTITNGTGTQSRTCNSGTWSSYGTCTVSTCNSGYQISGNACVATTCSGSSTQSCTITNGTGTQSRTCNSGTWSTYGSCTLSTCNSGYQKSGDTCTLIPVLPVTPSWQSGLLSWWTLDGNGNDSVGTNNGTVTGATTTSTNCRKGQCYLFNDNSDYITLNSPITQSVGTYSFWVKATDFSDDRLVLADDGYYQRIFFTSSGYPRMETNTNGQEFEFYNSAIGTSSLRHVVLVRNGNSLSYYLDGNLISTATVSGADAITISQIGYNGRSFRGTIDEVMIWNRALSSSEVSQIYTYFGGTTPPVCTPESTSTTCSGKCGTQANNCGTSVNCGVCSTPSTGTTYAVIGDSMSDSITSDWPSYFISKMGLSQSSISDYAVSGNTCAQVYNQLSTKVLSGTETLFVTCGVNALSSVDNSYWYEQIYNLAKQKGISNIYMTTMPPYENINNNTTLCNKMKTENAWLKNFDSQHSDLNVVDLWTLWHDTSGTKTTDCGWKTSPTLTSDGVHPNSTGYEQWAQKYYELINNSGTTSDIFNIYFKQDFQHRSPGTYTSSQIASDWNDAGGANRSTQKVVIEDESGNKIMKNYFYKDLLNGSNGFSLAAGGLDWYMNLPNQNQEEIYVSYRMKFSENMATEYAASTSGSSYPSHWLSGKFGLGFYTNMNSWPGAGYKPTPDMKSFFILTMFDSGKTSTNDKLQTKFYVNHLGMTCPSPDPNCWGNSESINYYFSPNTWYDITVRLVLNTPGSSNGLLEYFVNGKLVSSIPNYRFRDYSDVRITKINFANFLGGSGTAPWRDGWWAYDDFVIYNYNNNATSIPRGTTPSPTGRVLVTP